MPQVKVKVEWNQAPVLKLIEGIIRENEDDAAKRVMKGAIRRVPIGRYGKYRYPKSKQALTTRKRGEKRNMGRWFKKGWKFRYPGQLMHSIRMVDSKFGPDGGTLVFAGNNRNIWYAHFVELGTVFFKEKRRGYKFLRSSLLKESRNFIAKIDEALKGDMNG